MTTKYKSDLIHRMKIAKGHFDKVIDMIESDEYCLKVTDQIFAIQNALKRVEELLLEHHLKTCVKDAIVSNKDIDIKVKEVIDVFKRK